MAKVEIEQWLKQDQEALVSSMFDYYAYLRTSPIAEACCGFEHHFTSRSRNNGRQIK
jgi:hypothetical protein